MKSKTIEGETGFMIHELVSVTVNITDVLVTHVGADEDRQLQLSCDAMLHLVICQLLTTLITQQLTFAFSNILNSHEFKTAA